MMEEALAEEETATPFGDVAGDPLGEPQPPPGDGDLGGGEGLTGYNPSEGEVAPGLQGEDGDEEGAGDIPADPHAPPAAPEPEDQHEPAPEAEEPAPEPDVHGDQELPAPVDQDLVGLGAAEAEADEPPTPVEPTPVEPVVVTAPVGTDEFAVEAPEGNGSVRDRRYVIFEEVEHDDRKLYGRVGTAIGRNADIALRRGYRALSETRDEWQDTTLVPVAERMWQPRECRTRQRSDIAIDIGIG